MRGEHAAKVSEFEDKIDKLQKEIEAAKKHSIELEKELKDLKVSEIVK